MYTIQYGSAGPDVYKRPLPYNNPKALLYRQQADYCRPDQLCPTVALNADMSCRQKLFHCTFSACRKFFTSRTQLQIHTRTHTGEKPHKCLNCGKAFAQSNNLYRHLRDGAFEQSNNLYRHLRASKECAVVTTNQTHIGLEQGLNPGQLSEKLVYEPLR
ncbi:hypothetical protein DPMN_156979 [Dreissena polymorpha]|uniref:C2H2-type domain-containing protein n=1 Tax=Dreissena polymorpha TaxID=45954 RepID=A0A9D4FUH9_DREPO|nr:hypothetical protein DPMN_156979 [Dreissena polymorpha]